MFFGSFRERRIYCHTRFFFKNKLYKNTQAEIEPKIKNKLRKTTRLKFWSDKFKKFVQYLVRRLRLTKLVKFMDAVLIVTSFFEQYFLVPFYCSGQLIHCLEISGNKNNLRTTQVWNRQKIKNSLASAESYWFL